MRHAFIIAFSFLLAAPALAEGPEDAPPPGQPPPGEPQPIMTPEGQYVEQQPQQVPVVEEQPTTGAEGRGIEYGLHVVVPIFLKKGINPGIGLQLRGGWEFGGGLTAELNVGAMINGYTDAFRDELAMMPAIGDRNAGHSNIWIGAGVRYMFFNPSALVPMVGAGIKLNIWNLCADSGDSVVCQGDSDLSLGLNGMVGAAYEISPFIAIEAGLQVELTGGMPAFPDGAMFLLPFIGGTLYY